MPSLEPFLAEHNDASFKLVQVGVVTGTELEGEDMWVGVEALCLRVCFAHCKLTSRRWKRVPGSGFHRAHRVLVWMDASMVKYGQADKPYLHLFARSEKHQNLIFYTNCNLSQTHYPCLLLEQRPDRPHTLYCWSPFCCTGTHRYMRKQS